MADQKKAGMISGMSPLAVLTGDELMEVSSRQTDGTWKTFSINVNKIRTNQGLSAYEVAVVNGFEGTQAEWLESLNGKSAYQVAVEFGYVGTEAEWLESLVGASAYEDAVAQGYDGTLTEWLETLKGQSAYQLAVVDGFVGNEAAWLESLKGQSAYQLAKAIDPTVGSEADWLQTLVGKSAYQVALEQGFVGTEAAWLKSLEGKSAFQIWQAIPGNENKTEQEFVANLKGTDGIDGQSAYELWVEQPGNAGKTEAQFFEAIKGEDGTNGTDGQSAYQLWESQAANQGKSEDDFLLSLKGEDGRSAYDVAVAGGFVGNEAAWLESLKGTDGLSAYEEWLLVPANAGKSEAEFLASLKGESAYQVWLRQPGNAGKSEAEYIASLKGARGEQGMSAYQVWINAGNTGSETVFLNSLKGTNGTNGTNGIDGKDGNGIDVIATLSQTDFDQIVEEGMSEVGDAYFVADFLYVFNGEEWVKSPSLRGPTGTGLNYLGVWPNGQALPLGPTYNAGDTYMWQNNMWTLMDNPTRAWVATGVPGPQGKSAYQVWVEQPGNSGKTEAQFFESLKGTKGDTGGVGPDGKSAYQVALEQGFVGTEAAWLKSLEGKSAFQIWQATPGNEGKTQAEFFQFLTGPKGEDGRDGTNGTDGTNGRDGVDAVAFTIEGQLSEESELPRPGDATKAYYVGQNLYVWIESKSDYENLGSLNGASAYQIWLSQPGNSGTEEDFLNSLKGQSAYQLWEEQAGNVGKTEVEFLESLKGTDGKDGTDGTNGKDGTDGKNLQVNGTKADEAAIKALADPVSQDAWVADDTGHLWIYSGTQWFDAGAFRGPKGEDGKDGTNGTDGKDGTNGKDGTDGTNGQSTYELWVEQPGNAGKTEAEFFASLKGTDGKDGTNGTDGKDGTNGRNVEIKGSVADEAALGSLPNPQPQDAYTTQDLGILFMYISGSWTNLGRFRGDQGIQGERGIAGPGLIIVDEVEALTDLPPAATLRVGDAVYVVEEHKLFQVNDAGVYGPGITIQGPTGEEGPEGKQGPAGTSITINGSYATEAALIAAHPTGVAGEGYLVGPDLYLYGVNPANGTTQWYNAGPIRGPQGEQGVPGPRGLRGLIGETGQRGSLWLVLPQGVSEPTAEYGRDGDWAVNSQFDSFYKDELSGWALIGRLVAGDVNSPLASLGKVVREGDQWVKLPVDAVPNPVNGSQYVMKGNAQGGTEWTLLTIPDSGIPEVPASTTVPQGRTSAGWTAVMALPTNQDATKRYEYMNKTWVLSAVQAAAPAQVDTALCYSVNSAGVGSWVTPTFDRYSLKQDTTARNGSFTPDFAVQQTFRINGGSGSTATTVTLPAGTTARTMMAVFVVEGSTNKLAFVAGTGTPTLGYNNGVAAADIEYGTTQTVITAFWNGFGTWIIAKGPSF